MVVESSNFLELDNNLVSRILSSNGLHVDTELEVFDAVCVWLSYNLKERSEYAKTLLMDIRLPLLSDHALKYTFSKIFHSTEDSTSIINEVLQIQNKMFTSSCDNNYSQRYCSQKKFSTFLSGGFEVNYIPIQNEFKLSEKNFKIDMETLKCEAVFNPIKDKRKNCKAFCIKGEVYVYGGSDENHKRIKSIEKYSPATNTWKFIGEVYDDRNQFSCCSFTTKIVIISGSDAEVPCVAFDTRDAKWREFSPLKERRFDAACAVFEGRIVVSGGWYYDNDIKTVEAYDHVADAWVFMPDMNEDRCHHKSVAIRNKLFVIGGGHWSRGLTCEVFDSTCNKFAYLKQFPDLERFKLPQWAFAFGSEIVLYYEKAKNRKSMTLAYDVESNEWLEKSYEVLENITCYSYAKLPDLTASI